MNKDIFDLESALLANKALENELGGALTEYIIRLATDDAYINSIYSSSFFKGKSVSRAAQIKKIAKAYQNGTLVLVLGAGISAPYRLPDWNSLLQKLLLDTIKLETNEPEESSRALSILFTRLFPGSPLISARYLSEYYNKSTDGKAFDEAIRRVLYEDIDRSGDSEIVKEIVRFFSLTGKGAVLDSIITYNYDDILETALSRSGGDIPHRAVYTAGMSHKHGETPIYHVHGFLPQKGRLTEKHSVTLSENIYHRQYNDIYSWSNIVQINKFRERTCLLLGSSFSDPNLRRLLDIAMQHRGTDGARHYLIKCRHRHDAVAKKLELLLSNEKGLLDEGTKAGLKLEETVSHLIRIMERFEERDAGSFGVGIIWIDDFSEIPPILKKIRSG